MIVDFDSKPDLLISFLLRNTSLVQQPLNTSCAHDFNILGQNIILIG